MTEPNPSRGEVALKFGDGAIILRLSYDALGKLEPLLCSASPEVAANRHRWLAISNEPLGPDHTPPPVERMEWHHHFMGAVAAAEAATVARCIAICAEEHHPELTFEQVMDQSPSWGLVWRAFYELRHLFHWKPGEMPEVGKSSDAPFALARRLLGLSALRSRTASAQPNSGH